MLASYGSWLLELGLFHVRCALALARQESDRNGMRLGSYLREAVYGNGS
jgi:hypothetical protein